MKVLGTLLLLLTLFAALFLYRPAAQHVGRTDPSVSASRAGFDLTLRERDGKCHFSYEGHGVSGEVLLDMPPPCRFMLDSDGTIQGYAEGRRQLIVVVGGTLIEDPTDPLTARPDCGSTLAGLVLLDGGYSVSSYSAGSGVYCAEMGLDQRDLWLLLNG